MIISDYSLILFCLRHTAWRAWVGLPPMAMEYSVGVPMPVDEHAQLRESILIECGLHPPVVQLAAPDAAMRLLACARVASLDDREVYFGPSSAGWAAWAMTPPVKGERERVALSPRNETAACALVLELCTEAGEAAAAVLLVARSLCDTALAPPTDENTASAAPPDDNGVGDAMIAWTKAVGATPEARNGSDADGCSVSIVPARFPNTGRGAAAASDLPAGTDAVRVPSHTSWTVQCAFDDPGPRGEAYRTFAALGEDTVASLWLVYEMFGVGQNGKWAPLLNALPKRGGLTPVSWPADAIAALLGGTPVYTDAVNTHEKLTRQYAALFPALSEHYQEVFPSSLYTLENFRAATEAWNAYGMTVLFPEDGARVSGSINSENTSETKNQPVTCLPPIALLCNHSVWPHAVRYSKLRGNALHVPIARSVRSGSEVFVSYGSKSNAELLLFYGFCVENNPYDDVPLSLELPNGEVGEVTRTRAACLQKFNLQLSPHAVRANNGLAPGLVGTLRVLTADAAALATCVIDPRLTPVSSEGEAHAAATLCGALAALIEQLDEGDAALQSAEGAVAAAQVSEASRREAEVYRQGVRRTLEQAAGEARAWRAAVGGGPDPSLGKRTRD